MMVGECILGCGDIGMHVEDCFGVLRTVWVGSRKTTMVRSLFVWNSLVFYLNSDRRGRGKEIKRRRESEKKEDANLFPHALLFISRTLVVDFAQPLIDFLLLCRAPAKEHVIYKGIFKQGQKHEHKTAHEVDVDGFHVRNLWEGLPKVGVNRGHGKHRCHTLYHTEREKPRNLC